MNKFTKKLAVIFIFSLLAVSFISLASAEWWNPLSWFSSTPEEKNAADQKQIDQYRQELEKLKTDLANAKTNAELLDIQAKMNDYGQKIDALNQQIANRNNPNQQAQAQPKTAFWLLKDRDFLDFIPDLVAILVAAMWMTIIGTYYKYFNGEAGKQKAMSAFGGFMGFLKAFGLLVFLHVLLGYFTPGLLRVLRIIIWPMYYWDYASLAQGVTANASATLWETVKTFFVKVFNPNQSLTLDFTKNYIKANLEVIGLKGIVTAFWLAFGYSVVRWIISKSEEAYHGLQNKKRERRAKSELEAQEFRERVEKEKARILKTVYKQ